jgi:hypothetical protein
VLVTATGNEVLTAAVPKFVEDLESWDSSPPTGVTLWLVH